ncbi:MAG: DUF424 family protein [Thermoplasmata archaeon]|nr:DUF424 family protein [Thermoplasmata archaeon]
MILRVYKRGKDVVVAACDEELLNKTFKCGELRLHVSKNFYGEEICEEDDLIAALKFCTSANLVGSRTIDIAIKAGFIKPEGIIRIGDIPHAQLYRIF